MFKIARISIEGLMFFTVLAFLAIWVVLQEFGTVLVWLLSLFLVLKIAKHLKETRVITYYPPPTKDYKQASCVSEPVVIDRYPMLERSLDKDLPQV